MILSRLRLHPRDLAVLRDVGDVRELHRTVMRGFDDQAGQAPRARLGVLFRLETGPDLALLVQSLAVPHWDRLPEGYVLEAECKRAESVLDAVRPGRILHFRLVANPSRKTKAVRPSEEVPRNSRRVALTSDDERLDWLIQRGEAGGFAVGQDLRIDPLPPFEEAGRRRDRIYVRPVRYEGFLRITDAGRFRASLREGIGPAKAYGCGLLSIAPM